MIIDSKSSQAIERCIRTIFDKFPGKNLGDSTSYHILQWKIQRTQNKISISQAKASNEIVKRFGIENSKAVSTPFDTQVVLGVDGIVQDAT
jgi:hypothetical protein